MMSSTQLITDHTQASEETREVIRSRFGEIAIDTRNALLFPKGLLGMPQCQHFILAEFPSERMQQFKLLQNLEDFSMSFISLPIALDNAIIARNDLLAGVRELGIPEEALAVLLIVCVHRGPESTRLSVNARAPLFIDTRRKTGAQHVFTHDNYRVQHYIN